MGAVQLFLEVLSADVRTRIRTMPCTVSDAGTHAGQRGGAARLPSRVRAAAAFARPRRAARYCESLLLKQVQRPGRRAARSLCAVIGMRRYLSRAAYGTHAARLLRAAWVAAV